MQIPTDQGSKSQGKLMHRVVQMFADRQGQRILKCNDGTLPQHSNNFVSTLTSSIVTELAAKQIFLELNDHMLDLTVESNHVYTLMECTTPCFIKMTMHALAESYIEIITGNKVQKELSKHVLFEHQ